MESKITCIKTANPSMRMSQQEVLDVVLTQDFSARSKKFYTKFLLDPGVHTRTFGIDSVALAVTESGDASAKRFEDVASQLAIDAGQQCLKAANLSPEDIDGLIVATCTGYLCPGLTSYVSQGLGMKSEMFILDLTGHGCGAALPGLRIADQFLKNKKNGKVMFIAVEVCSATFFHGESIDLLISNSIFGDGAAACIVSSGEGPGWVMEQHEGLLFPEYREQLRYKTVNSRLCNVLSKEVPHLVAKGVKELLRTMNIQQLPQFLALHPGGRVILDTLQEVFKIPARSLEPSRYILSEYGNMSSPSVLYVLKRLMETNTFEDNTEALLISYGAGMSVNGTSLRWRK